MVITYELVQDAFTFGVLTGFITEFAWEFFHGVYYDRQPIEKRATGKAYSISALYAKDLAKRSLEAKVSVAA
jgi:hypothetical protein